MFYPKISIVTPNLNTGEFIERTILSVLSQGYPNLEYIVVDGGSTDHSLSIIRDYQSDITHWVSEADNGLYDALNKGFKMTSGEIMGYLNSDDMLYPGALVRLAQLFSKHSAVQWLQGYPTVFNEHDKVIFTRPPRHLARYFYARRFTSSHEFIQQESTFWSRRLWEKAGGRFNSQYRLAGDFELWLRFYRHEKLYVTRCLIGGFRSRSDQLSGNTSDYIQECERALIRDASTHSATKKLQITIYRLLYSVLPRLVDALENFRLRHSYLEPWQNSN